MSRTVFVLVALLAACGPPDNTPQGVCARRAEDDPQVRELVMISGSTTEALISNRENLKIARQSATNKCLSGFGLQPPGGVEIMRRN